MDKGIMALVEEAHTVNSKIVSVPRLLILVSLENLGLDGAAYRELKAALDMEDGILYSNLKAMEGMGYLEEVSIRLENKEMASYHMTKEGREALNIARSWLVKMARRVG
jgi:DNA-binding MarR family transcriptional regulator